MSQERSQGRQGPLQSMVEWGGVGWGGLGWGGKDDAEWRMVHVCDGDRLWFGLSEF